MIWQAKTEQFQKTTDIRIFAGQIASGFKYAILDGISMGCWGLLGVKEGSKKKGSP